jgi:hypothetical protein
MNSEASFIASLGAGQSSKPVLTDLSTWLSGEEAREEDVDEDDRTRLAGVVFLLVVGILTDER